MQDGTIVLALVLALVVLVLVEVEALALVAVLALVEVEVEVVERRVDDCAPYVARPSHTSTRGLLFRGTLGPASG